MKLITESGQTLGPQFWYTFKKGSITEIHGNTLFRIIPAYQAGNFKSFYNIIAK